MVKGRREVRDGVDRDDLRDRFPYMSMHHPYIDQSRNDKDFKLALQKVPFAYTAMAGPEYFDKPALLAQSAYDNNITGERCEDKDYEKVKDVLDRYSL